MRLRELEYLKMIFECGSISEAARRLYVSQSTLSKFLLNLEKEQNVILFTRDGKRLIPTEAGRMYLEFAVNTLRSYALMQKRIEDLETHGSLKIGIPYGNEILITHAMVQFHKLFPDVHVELVEKDFSLLDNDLNDGVLDIAFTGNRSEGRYISVLFCNEEVVLCDPERDSGNTEEYGYLDIHTLKDKTFLFPSENLVFNARINEVLEDLQFEPKDRLYVKNHRQVSRLGNYGYGPYFLIIPDRYTGFDHSHLYRFTEEPLLLPLYLTYSPHSRNEKLIREFLHILDPEKNYYLGFDRTPILE